MAITAAISPYQESRARARAEIGNFVEIYVDCPLSVCMQRDVKGLYAKAVRGEVPNFTGISDPYEPPVQPEVVVHTERESPEESMRKIIDKLVALDMAPYQLHDRLLKERNDVDDAEPVKAAPMFVLIGIPLMIALALATVVFSIIGGIKANEGELWEYPLTMIKVFK